MADYQNHSLRRQALRQQADRSRKPPKPFWIVMIICWLATETLVMAPTRIELGPERLVRQPTSIASLFAASPVPEIVPVHRYAGIPKTSLIRNTVALDRKMQQLVTEIVQEYPMGLPQIDKADLARHLIEQSRSYNFDPFFILSVILAESGLDNFAVSSVGALGLMQIMPSTGAVLAKELGYAKWTSGLLFNPYVNIQLGTYYLSKLKQKFGHNGHKYLAAYNEGPGAIRFKLKKRRSVESSYTTKIMSFYHHFAVNPLTKPYTAITLY